MLRTNRDMAAERERIAAYFDVEPDETLTFVAEMDMGAPGGDGPLVYGCPMPQKWSVWSPGTARSAG
jgi:hypothetical protein